MSSLEGHVSEYHRDRQGDWEKLAVKKIVYAKRRDGEGQAAVESEGTNADNSNDRDDGCSRS